MDHNKRKGPGEAAPTEATTYKGEVPRSEEKRRKQAKLCRQFKASLCHKDVKVHFVGAWYATCSLPEICSDTTSGTQFRLSESFEVNPYLRLSPGWDMSAISVMRSL